MSNSVQPHRWQPTRLPCPWDSPGKNTGVGCHFLLKCMKVKVKSVSRVRLLATPWTAANRLLHPWDFASKSTGVGCHCLLRVEGITINKFKFSYFYSSILYLFLFRERKRYEKKQIHFYFTFGYTESLLLYAGFL